MTYLVSAPRRVQVEFSLDLARLSGYSHNMRYTHRHPRLSKNPPDLRGRIHSVYVYCDVLEHVLSDPGDFSTISGNAVYNACCDCNPTDGPDAD